MADVHIETDEEQFTTQRGQLVAVDFRDHTCTILTELGAIALDDLSDRVVHAVRQDVIVFGIGSFNEGNNHPVTLHLLRIEIAAEVQSITELEAEFTAYADEHDTVANFRQAWKEARTGQTRPVSELWDALDDE